MVTQLVSAITPPQPELAFLSTKHFTRDLILIEATPRENCLDGKVPIMGYLK